MPNLILNRCRRYAAGFGPGAESMLFSGGPGLGKTFLSACIARAVAEQTGAETCVFYACHNLTQDDFEAGKTYLDFMWENVETLKEALGQKEG